jgi:hypothetical protein
MPWLGAVILVVGALVRSPMLAWALGVVGMWAVCRAR